MRRRRGDLKRLPLDPKPPTVAEERPPDLIAHIDLDAKAGGGFIIPLAHLGNTAEKHGETKSKQPLVKALFAGTQTKAALRVYREIDVDGEVFVSAEVIHRRASL